MPRAGANAARRGPLLAPQLESQPPISPAEGEAILRELASVFLSQAATSTGSVAGSDARAQQATGGDAVAQHEAMYRVLVEQIPAVVFIAYLDRGIGEAYVSPQIESALGFSQEEWLEDPIRWYQQIHPDDKGRWSVDAAHMLLTGDPLKASYRVIARDGRTVWFQCEAKMVRRPDGRPWFLHGVGFDISELKRTENVLQERTSALQNLSSRILRLQDEERRRIARELHDSLGQYLSALKMNIGVIRRTASNRIKKICSDSMRTLDRCITEVRTLSYLLHPPLLDEMGFAAASNWYIEGFAKRSGIEVTSNIPGTMERLPTAIEIVLFRVLQESLTNIHRHSGSLSADVHLGFDENLVSLQIKDRGRGVPAALVEKFHASGSGTGVGLAGMRERVNELGGRLELESDSQGTLVRGTIPLGQVAFAQED